MEVIISLSNLGGELAFITVDATDESDIAIQDAVIELVTNGIQVGDTLTVSEIE